MWAIIKKEIKTYFLSPIGYVFIGALLLMASSIFYFYIYASGSIQYSLLFFYMVELLTFSTALLTMSMFAGERKNGTETLLLTSPKSITSIVLGKFFAAVIVIIITMILSLIYYIILCAFAGGINNIQSAITTLIGFLLVAMSYISLGLFVSSFTENQIIAGIVTIAVLFVSLYMPDISTSLSIISPAYLFQKYPYSVLPITESITLITQTVMFIVLTIIVMQRRKILK